MAHGTNMKSQEVSSLETHIGYWMRFISNHVSHTFSLSLEPHGVTVAEWVVMRELSDSEPTTPSRLADHLSMTRGAISKLIERLVSKGLVNRSSDEMDRRSQSIALSETGRLLVPQLAELADQNDATFFGHLDQAQRQIFMALLKDIAERHHLKGPPLD